MKTQKFRHLLALFGLFLLFDFTAITSAHAVDMPLPVRRPDPRAVEKQHANTAKAAKRSAKARTKLTLTADNKIGIIYFYEKCRFKKIRSENRHNYQLDMRTRMMLRFRPDPKSKKTIKFYPVLAEDSVTFYAEKRAVKRDRAIYCRRLGQSTRAKVKPIAAQLRYLDGTLQVTGDVSVDGRVDNRRCYVWQLEVEYAGKKLYKYEPVRVEVDCPAIKIKKTRQKSFAKIFKEMIDRKFKELKEQK